MKRVSSEQVLLVAHEVHRKRGFVDHDEFCGRLRLGEAAWQRRRIACVLSACRSWSPLHSFPNCLQSSLLSCACACVCVCVCVYVCVCVCSGSIKYLGRTRESLFPCIGAKTCQCTTAPWNTWTRMRGASSGSIRLLAVSCGSRHHEQATRNTAPHTCGNTTYVAVEAAATVAAKKQKQMQIREAKADARSKSRYKKNIMPRSKFMCLRVCMGWGMAAARIFQ